MIIEISSLVIAIALAITGSFTFWPVQTGLDFYRPLLLFIGGYLVMIFVFWWWVFVLFGLPFDEKKQFEKPSRWAEFWLMQGLAYINNHAFIKYELRGKSKLPKGQRFLLVCNHRSKFDSMLISQHLGKHRIAFITKEDNMKVPLAHRFLHGCCYLPVDRDDKLQSLEQFNKASTLIQKGYSSIGVFPEGTRQNKKTISEFHEGVFNIAIRAKAPIVVMTSNNCELIHKNFPKRFTHVRQDVLGVIPYSEIEGKPAKEVSDMVHEIMESHLNKIKNLK